MQGERTPDGIRMGNSDPKADVGNVRAVFGGFRKRASEQWVRGCLDVSRRVTPTGLEPVFSA